MGKLTDEQAAALAELKAIEEAPDEEDDYEVWIENDKGHKTKLPSKKASGYLKEQFGIDLHPAAAAEGEGGEGGEGAGGEDEGDPGPKGGGGYFKSRSKG
jgi:hypothetical protein